LYHLILHDLQGQRAFQSLFAVLIRAKRFCTTSPYGITCYVDGMRILINATSGVHRHGAWPVQNSGINKPWKIVIPQLAESQH
jgi:hypothetical protein